MGDLHQALELLGTALRLESRLSDFQRCALHLTATADSDFGWQVGWEGKAFLPGAVVEGRCWDRRRPGPYAGWRGILF